MRSYPRNSPKAATRIVVLAMLADAHLCARELQALERLDAATELGLDPLGLHQVIQEFCEDLMASAQHGWSGAGEIDPSTLSALLGEVDDPALQRKVLRLAVAAVEADGHLSDGEACVLEALVGRWRLEGEMLAPVSPITTAQTQPTAAP